jgi:hypothetical protein
MDLDLQHSRLDIDMLCTSSKSPVLIRLTLVYKDSSILLNIAFIRYVTTSKDTTTVAVVGPNEDGFFSVKETIDEIYSLVMLGGDT